jgi:hypothetical protein
MGKNHRGRGIWDQPNHGRGTCPVCGRTGVKVLYEVKTAEKPIKVCKLCKNHKPAEA